MKETQTLSQAACQKIFENFGSDLERLQTHVKTLSEAFGAMQGRQEDMIHQNVGQNSVLSEEGQLLTQLSERVNQQGKDLTQLSEQVKQLSEQVKQLSEQMTRLTEPLNQLLKLLQE